MNARAFHNMLRIMRNISMHDLRDAGVVNENWGTPEASDRNQLEAFFQEPYNEALRMPDANFDMLYALIQKIQSETRQS